MDEPKEQRRVANHLKLMKGKQFAINMFWMGGIAEETQMYTLSSDRTSQSAREHRSLLPSGIDKLN